MLEDVAVRGEPPLKQRTRDADERGSAAAVEDNWAFWCQVYDYDNGDEHQQIDKNNSDETARQPSLTEVLSGVRLQKTKIVVANAPNSCAEIDLRNLIEAKVRRSGCVMSISKSIRGLRWVIQFYRAAEAAAAVLLLNNLRFRGALLQVHQWHQPVFNRTRESFDGKLDRDVVEHGCNRPATKEASAKLCDPNAEVANSTSTVRDKLEAVSKCPVAVEHRPYPLLPVRQPPPLLTIDGSSAKADNLETKEQSTRQPPAELGQFWQSACSASSSDGREAALSSFWRHLEQLLSRRGPLSYKDDELSRLICATVEPLRTEILQWRLGLFRCSHLPLVGNYVCLPEDELEAFDCMRKDKANFATAKEHWEPFPPCTIYTDSGFVQYTEALVRRYGVVRLDGALFGMFQRSLSSSSYRTAGQERILELIDVNSCLITVIDSILYALDSSALFRGEQKRRPQFSASKRQQLTERAEEDEEAGSTLE